MTNVILNISATVQLFIPVSGYCTFRCIWCFKRASRQHLIQATFLPRYRFAGGFTS